MGNMAGKNETDASENSDITHEGAKSDAMDTSDQQVDVSTASATGNENSKKQKGKKKKRLKAENKKLRDEKERLQEETMALNDEKKSLRQKLNDTEKELVVCRQKFGELNGQYDDLFQRYSQLVSSQIMNNNASIQDIDYHDPPRQVAETFHAELYNKQWGDAFDVLDKILTDERVKLEILRDFCRDSYLICVFVLCGQAENLRRALDPFSTKETIPAKSNNSVSVLSNVLDILPGPVREEFIRTRRQFKNFKRILDNQCCKGSTAERVKKICGEEVVYRLRQYIYSSIEVSWDMLLQTPPMVLDFSIEKGRAIDPEVMEHYSYPGPRVEFLVWPTVYRQCGGPVLSKAIVQTCRGDGKE